MRSLGCALIQSDWCLCKKRWLDFTSVSQFTPVWTGSSPTLSLTCWPLLCSPAQVITTVKQIFSENNRLSIINEEQSLHRKLKYQPLMSTCSNTSNFINPCCFYLRKFLAGLQILLESLTIRKMSQGQKSPNFSLIEVYQSLYVSLWEKWNFYILDSVF